jgi:hypothetical protein
MTFAQRVDAVSALGFSRRHATFVTLVLLNGGCFVRRQYCAFAGVKKGMTDWVIVRRLLAHHLARTLTYSAQHGQVYRLCGRPLYAAADLEYPVTRGEPSQALVARRLMLLDFVVTEPNLEWYTTPKEKSDLFAGRLGLAETLFPQKTRKTTTLFWTEDLPVFLLGQPPQVQFVCLATDPHASGVGAFVRQHAALLQQLSGWTLHVVAPRGSVVDGACEKAYERALHATLLSPAPEADRAWFERTRARVDAGDLSDVSIADLRRYRELATRIGNAVETRAAGPLVVHVLPYSYINFGVFAGIA